MEEPTKRFETVEEWKAYVSKLWIEKKAVIRKYIEMKEHQRVQQELYEEQKKACEEYGKWADALCEELKGKPVMSEKECLRLGEKL
jgi:hypothetical protein